MKRRKKGCVLTGPQNQVFVVSIFSIIFLSFLRAMF